MCLGVPESAHDLFIYPFQLIDKFVVKLGVVSFVIQIDMGIA